MDNQTRRDRTQKRNDAFSKQTPFLVEAFLWHQHRKDEDLGPEIADSEPFEMTVIGLDCELSESSCLRKLI